MIHVLAAVLLQVTVAPGSQSPTAGIQEAIDSLGPGGGVVTISPGEYILRRTIHVRSHVTLQGAGEKSVLRKAKQVGSKLAAPLKPGSRSVQVQSAAGFREGDELAFYDQATVGWMHGHAVVKGVQGNELLLDKAVGRAFDPAQGAAVVTIFSAIAGVGTSRGVGLTKVVLKDLTLDGNREENPGPSVVAARAKGKPPELGFQFAALNLMDATGLLIEGCRVRGWPADGISVQRGSGNRVTKCVVENCRGPGYHAGGGEKDSEFSDNEARGNLDDGFYFCAWVTRITVRNNRFIGNQGSGVGGLGDGGDTQNVIEGNLCEGNGKSGISAWGGEGNTLKNNTCLNNSASSPGRWSGINLASTMKTVLSGNKCSDTQAVKTQKFGIDEGPNCRENAITDNDCKGNGLSLSGKEGTRAGNLE